MTRYSLIILVLLLAVSCKEDPDTNKVYKEEVPATVSVEVLDSAHIHAGALHRITMSSEFIKPRPVDVWLPSGYSKDQSYAVLYMHDGQMLFDSSVTWNKQEWKVDEWATSLMNAEATKKFIVVGIHNISEIRWFDLFPQKAFDYLDEEDRDSLLAAPLHSTKQMELNGDQYLKFLVHELKPVIDENFSVSSDRENTYIAGSSMGGLMSMYAISEYPEVFHGAACLSTHWVGAVPSETNPLPEAIFSYMKDHFPEAGKHLVYFDYGNKTLDQYYPQYAPRLDEILAAKGYTKNDSRNLFFEGTNHSENAWNKRLEYPFQFLLGR